MGIFKEYEEFDGIGLAELVKTKKISPEELVEAAILRIENKNPSVNAVITKMFDDARLKSKSNLPDGTFKGVPFLVKDILTGVKGIRFTSGSRAYKNRISDYNSEIVNRFHKTGLVILGKTNVPEFGLLGITEPELFGATRNPWDTTRTPGGSSGGSAAAIASGMVPMASGNDGGGSIRIPASCCGLFGLKPSRGRNPSGPVDGRLWQGAATEGILSRSVRDSAAMLDATNGPDSGAPFAIMSPERPFIKEAETDPGKLKIAFSTESPVKMPVHAECVKAVTNTVKLLEDLGHHVEEKAPPVNGFKIAKSYFTMYYGEVAADIKKVASYLGRKVTPKDVEEMTYTLGLIGRSISAGDFVEAMNDWDTFARIMGSFHEAYDVYITPTTAEPPIKIGALAPTPVERIGMKIINTFNLGKLLVLSGMAEKIAIKSFSKTPFTQLANLTGQPAMSMPIHFTKNNLPVGVQFTAKLGNEKTLFRLAGQIEKERPWFHKTPGK